MHLILIGPFPSHSGSRDWPDHPMQLYHLAALCVMQMSASDPIRPDLLGRRRRSRPGAWSGSVGSAADLGCICFHLEHNQCTQHSLAPSLPLDGVCLPRCAINDAFRLKFSGKTLFDALSNYDYGVCLPRPRMDVNMYSIHWQQLVWTLAPLSKCMPEGPCGERTALGEF